jgi:hypothetical protein
LFFFKPPHCNQLLFLKPSIHDEARSKVACITAKERKLIEGWVLLLATFCNEVCWVSLLV